MFPKPPPPARPRVELGTGPSPLHLCLVQDDRAMQGTPDLPLPEPNLLGSSESPVTAAASLLFAAGQHSGSRNGCPEPH